MDIDEMYNQLALKLATKFGAKLARHAPAATKEKETKKKQTKETTDEKVTCVPDLPKGFNTKHNGQIKDLEKIRLNPIPRNWDLPVEFLIKRQPVYQIGQIYRIQHIMANVPDFIEKEGTVAGWVRSARSQENNTLIFVELNDGSTHQNLQIVINKSVKNFPDLLKNINTGTSVKITGKFIKSPHPKQPIELQVKDSHEVLIVGQCDPEKYPMHKGYQTAETLREKAHLRPRSNLIGCITRIRNNLAFATHNFFQLNGCQYIHTPLITASDCEGAGEMFQVTTLLERDGKISESILDKNKNIDYTKDFFKKPAFLTVSGQLAVENFCMALSNVYTFGPTFRAENSHTSRHLAEFWMIEPELAFADLYDNMDCAESYVKFCINYCLKNNQDDLGFLQERVKPGLVEYLKKIASQPFARVSYTEGIEILEDAVKQGAKFEMNVKWGMDLQSEHERFIAEKVFQKPVILYNYPKEIKAFYMKVTEDGKCVRAMDILVPQIGELIGGSQREERLEVLEDRIKECNLILEDYWWYLDLRRYGSVPHAGFGLGFERLVMMISGVENIRDVIPYPRYPGKAEF